MPHTSPQPESPAYSAGGTYDLWGWFPDGQPHEAPAYKLIGRDLFRANDHRPDGKYQGPPAGRVLEGVNGTYRVLAGSALLGQIQGDYFTDTLGRRFQLRYAAENASHKGGQT